MVGYNDESVGLYRGCARQIGSFESRDQNAVSSTCILFHLAVLCDSLRCGAYGTFCSGVP